MINYEPFWRTIKDKKVSTYALREKHGISSETLHRLRHNKPVTTTTLNDLCGILDCGVSDIIRYERDDPV